jgi:hypothetical protein
MRRSAELLLTSLMDYAGTFPPARRHFFVGFGSCSFTEPVDELARLGVVTSGAESIANPHAEVQ